MRAKFPWLPVGFAVDGECGLRRVLEENQYYQFCDTTNDSVCVIIREEFSTIEAARGFTGCDFSSTTFSDENFLYYVSELENAPVRVASIPARSNFYSAKELCDLAKALATVKNHSWAESIYFPNNKKILPFGAVENKNERYRLATMLLTSGVSDAPLSPKQIRNINGWVTIEEICEFYRTLGVENPKLPVKESANDTHSLKKFTLPGQPYLENFFQEHIIDFYSQKEKFEKMGVKPINGILLHGGPGVGKTYSVQKLASFLKWHLEEINLGEIGSMYIHETSRNIRKKFDNAKKRAPSIVFLDELDAMGGSREMMNESPHKIEEITELLKQMEKTGNGVWVIAATNQLEAIDKALIRKGRFDEIIRIKFPDKKDIESVLRQELSDRPHAGGIDLTDMADKLCNRSLAEISYVVNEAARIAVREGKDKICQNCLERALKALPPERDPTEGIT